MNNQSRHLYDIITSKVVDPWKEYYWLKRLFFEDRFSTSSGCLSLKDYFRNAFKTMPIRGTTPSIDAFLSETFPFCKWDDCGMEDLIICCEVLDNILRCVPRTTIQLMPEDGRTVYLQILENISIVFEKAGYKFIKRGEFEYAVRKDAAVDEAIEHIKDDQVALDVLEYNRVSLKGNLARKKEILASVGLYAEQILKDSSFSAQFNQLRSDAGFCLNNLDIRHNPAAYKASQLVLDGMTDSELEEWYDRTYTLLISVILMNKTRDIHTQLEPLKQKAGNPNG